MSKKDKTKAKVTKVGPDEKTVSGLQFVVIDHEGSPSCDADAEPQSYQDWHEAVERAKQLADVNPGLPVVIYQKLATVKAEVDNPRVSMHAKFLVPVKTQL